MKFSLTALLWLFALLATGVTAFGPGYGLVAAVLCALWWWYLAATGVNVSRLAASIFNLTTFVWLLLGLFFVSLSIPAVGNVRPGPEVWRTCMSNIRELTLALLNYESSFSSFPPAAVVDGNGQPMHSWRVLLLPYLGENELYDQYNFDEPWNGPNNSKLTDQMPDVYRCPGCQACRGVRGLPWELPAGNCPSYHLVADPAAALHPTSGATFGSITDGPSNTIVLVESLEHSGNWLEPGGLSLAEATDLLSSRSTLRHIDVLDEYWRTRFFSTGGGAVGWADGHLTTEKPMQSDDARARLTAQGGETLEEPTHLPIAPLRHEMIRWDRIIPAVMFIGLTIAPFWWRPPSQRDLPPSPSGEA